MKIIHHSSTGSAYDDVQSQLEKLKLVTLKLRWYSMMLLLTAAANTGLFLGAIAQSYGNHISKVFGEIFPYGALSVGATAMTLVLMYGFELSRRHGELLFQEISDELQWRMRPTKIQKENTGDDASRSSRKRSQMIGKPPSINIRVILRQFVQQSELPFTRGSHGSIVYLGFNILMSVAAIVFGGRA